MVVECFFLEYTVLPLRLSKYFQKMMSLLLMEMRVKICVLAQFGG